jgi:hypothetical protein
MTRNANLYNCQRRRKVECAKASRWTRHGGRGDGMRCVRIERERRKERKALVFIGSEEREMDKRTMMRGMNGRS